MSEGHDRLCELTDVIMGHDCHCRCRAATPPPEAAEVHNHEQCIEEHARLFEESLGQALDRAESAEARVLALEGALATWAAHPCLATYAAQMTATPCGLCYTCQARALLAKATP